MATVNKPFFHILPFFLLWAFITGFVVQSRSQETKIIEIKKWKGEYPDMEGSYPLTFIAFKGDIIPVPHVFVRSYPTHYYLELVSLLVTDASVIAGEVKTSLLRIAIKLLEQNSMEGRHGKTTGIKINRESEKAINLELFQSLRDSLEDHYDLASRFVKVYEALAGFGTMENATEIKQLLEREADGLLTRYILVNLLQSNHGEKLKAFAVIGKELDNLLGDIDYTRQKLRYFNFNVAVSSEPGSFNFLTR